MGADEGDALELIGGAVLHALAAVAFLGAQEGVVKHGGHGDIVTAAELDDLWSLGLAVGVGVLFKVAAKGLVQSIGTDLGVYVIFQEVPSAAAGVEAGG